MIEILLAIIAILLFRIWLDMPSRRLWESALTSIAKSLKEIAEKGG